MFPIGYVRSPHKDDHDIPIRRGVSEIGILDAYGPGLRGLRTASHLIVLGYFHMAHKEGLAAFPRPQERRHEERGVFSVRCPARPNPIGYTVVRLLNMDDDRLTVEGLDFADGTPVLDIKPYSPGWDSIHCATRVRRTPLHEMAPEKAFDLLLRDAVNFCGEMNAEGLCSVAMTFLLATGYGVDPRDSGLNIELNQFGAALDALIGMCGATFGSGRVKIVGPSNTRLRCCFRWGNAAVTMRARKERVAPSGLNPRTAGLWVEVLGEDRPGNIQEAHRKQVYSARSL